MLPKRSIIHQREELNKFTKPTKSSIGATGGAGSAIQKKKITELEGEVAELKLTSDTLEKERDFYFGKLRDIEVLLQVCSSIYLNLGKCVQRSRNSLC